MTIKREDYKGTRNWGEIFCAPKYNGHPGCYKDGLTLMQIFHGCGSEENFPLSDDEIDALYAQALVHEEKFPDHLVRLIIYSTE